ncbi:MAG: hypothetical protein ACREA0_20215, partial [bacterium]
DQQAMRDLLRASWDSSNANDQQITRREMRGWLFEDSTGTLVFGVYPDPRSTPCVSFGAPPSPDPGIRIAKGHSHPFTPGELMVPPTCSFTELMRYTIEKYGGPSKGDILNVADEGLPSYIVDAMNLYVVPLGTDTLNAKSNVRPYPRVDPASGCTRL